MGIRYFLYCKVGPLVQGDVIQKFMSNNTSFFKPWDLIGQKEKNITLRMYADFWDSEYDMVKLQWHPPLLVIWNLAVTVARLA